VRLLTCPADDCPVVLFDSLSDPAREFCPTCSTPGATDSTLEWAVRATVPGKDPLLLPCPTAGVAQTTAGSINEDSSPATAEILSRPAVGWSEPA
jgi:hypothetical protein